ncbi:MAG: radical SAM protein [Theionarchaea archaeon]|nr:radical SAM protein [Theionarchaea archaeon]
MIYYYPGESFPAISVTGRQCQLMCPHCQGHYLKSMVEARTGRDLVAVCKGVENRGGVGCLISGGCDARGRVPLPLQAIKQVKEETHLILNVHTGLVDESTAGFLREINPYISFEIPTEAVLRELYQIRAKQEDYFSSLLHLEGLRVIPHVMVGFRTKYDAETISRIRDMGFDTLVLIVFTSTRGTPFENHVVDLQRVRESIEKARSLFPRLFLGCMRPRIRELEECAPLFDGIVVPTPWARDAVIRAGLPVRIMKTCCVVE